MRTRLWLLLVAPVVALGTAPCRAEWGNDLGDAGPALVESVRADLGAIVRASSQDREALVRAFVAARGASTIEASKRFRNPELRSLFHALALHDDWRVVHRALAALERMEAGAAFPRAFALLDDPRPRLREKAAITCLVLWSVAGPLVPADATTTIERRLVLEGEPHVRACLEALLARGRGRLVPEKLVAAMMGMSEDHEIVSTMEAKA